LLDDSAPGESLTLRDLLVPSDAEALMERLREVAETGRPVIDWTHSARIAAFPDKERVVSVTMLRLEEPDGTPTGVAAAFTEITEQYRAQRRLDLVNTAARRIGGSLEVGRCAEELAEALVPGFADLVAVDLTEVVLVGEDPGEFRMGAPLRRVAVASAAGPWPPELLALGERVLLRAEESAYVRDASAVWTPDLTTLRKRIGGDPERSRLLLPNDATSLLVAPMHARGLVLGSVGMWRLDHQRPFDAEDAALAEEITSRAALSVDNARRYTREHRVAEALQRSLLPPSVVQVTAAESAGTYLPAATTEGIGGSWFDVVALSSSRVAFVVGDVVGHGLEATAATGRLRTAVQTLADLDLAPEELLAHLDDLVVRLTTGDAPGGGSLEGAPAGTPAGLPDGFPESRAAGLTGGLTGLPDGGRERPEGWDGGPPGRGPDNVYGSTCLYAVYDPVSGRCSMASAGHPPPVILPPDGAAPRVADLKPGPALGVGSMPFEQREFDLAPDSVLVFVTGSLLDGMGAPGGTDREPDGTPEAPGADGPERGGHKEGGALDAVGMRTRPAPPTATPRPAAGRGARTDAGPPPEDGDGTGERDGGGPEGPWHGDGRDRLLLDRIADLGAGRPDPAALGGALLDRVLPEPPSHDVALLVGRVRPLDAGAWAAWEFPSDPAAVAQARERVDQQLAAWDLEHLVFTTELITSELVTNAIRYAGGPIGLRLIRDRMLVCEVSDLSQTQPRMRRARLTDEGGRGLFLIAQLAHRWGSRYTRNGKTIWTEQPLLA
jgi:GAF domain-containing protein/anti-sigma regulatory factor (Ser/Thr protein kinase)